MGRLDAPLTVDIVDAEVTRSLRHEVLRPGLPWDSTRFDGDDHRLGIHIAVRVLRERRPSEVVSVGSSFPDPPPWQPDRPDAWRIRGMATKEGWRGQGLGRRVLDALIAHAVGHAGTLIWCHARHGALDFYRRAGFVAVGEPFDDGLAVHQSMWRSLVPISRKETGTGS